eukprot:1384172-Amphidinium_carterae.1
MVFRGAQRRKLQIEVVKCVALYVPARWHSSGGLGRSSELAVVTPSAPSASSVVEVCNPNMR